MSPDLQAKMYEAIEYGRKFCDEQNLANEAKLLDFFKSKGLIITYPDEKAFRDYSFNYYVKTGLAASWDMDLYKKMQALAK
jgi:TRAP-type C4-dicarboxylate transport system substrate-binding protein